MSPTRVSVRRRCVAWRAAVASLALAAFVAGCSDGENAGENAGGNATITSPASSSADFQVVLPPKTQPTLPAEAKEQTEAGATAFVLFWFETLNYSLSNSDLSPLASYTSASCEQCSAWLLGISHRLNEGEVMEAGLTTPLSLAVGPPGDGTVIEFQADFLSNAALVTAKDGTQTAYPGQRGIGTVVVEWGTAGWVMKAVILPPASG